MAAGTVSGTPGIVVRVRPRWADDRPKPGWEAVLLYRSPEMLVLRGTLEHTAGRSYVTFAPGDTLLERYWPRRWYNIFSLYDRAGLFKGWYANICTPIAFDGQTIRYTDLDLDLWVWPDRHFLVLYEDEFSRRVEREMPPAIVDRARAGLAELLNDLAGEGPLFREPTVLPGA
jgi:protein associated with RNAse G/E